MMKHVAGMSCEMAIPGDRGAKRATYAEGDSRQLQAGLSATMGITGEPEESKPEGGVRIAQDAAKPGPSILRRLCANWGGRGNPG